MPQRKQVSWAQLRVGLLVLVSLAVLGVGVFFISGQVGFFTRRYTLKTYFSGASGLRGGSQVRVSGVPVGVVESIGISSFTEPERAVEVTMRIPVNYQKEIRQDSVAHLATAGLLGEAFVDITRGGAAEVVTPNGGTVKSAEEADIKRIVQNTNDVISNLRVLSDKLNDVTGQIQAGKGTLGKVIYDQAMYNRMNQITEQFRQLLDRVSRGEGTIGKLMADETLYNRTVASIDRLNKVLDDVQSGKGTLAKFINDPSVFNQAEQVLARANTLVDNVNKGQGTLGKLAIDQQLYNRMNDTFDRLNIIATRIEQGQGTLGKLSTDPTLYNNLSASSQSMREFLTEFRQNPKKYLTIKVRIF
ncbi:MAG: MlaD family protein [Terriglobia bacterium]|jgi:phospholipid/cholesterol/gamma-HCH transport system substrate-binding protein